MQTSKENKYFLIMSLICLAIVFIGFSPTFYLRPFFGRNDLVTGSPDLPIYIALHGLSMSLWYLVFAIQAYLIAKHKISYHRLLGYTALLIALAVVVTGFYISSNFIPRRLEPGLAIAEVVTDARKQIVVGNSIGLTLFATYIASAIYFRSKSHIHKRLMLFASVTVIGAAFGGTIRGFSNITAYLSEFILPEFINITDLFWLIVICGTIFIDKVIYKKIHLVTILCSSALILLYFFEPVIARSEIGTAYIYWLSGINM